MPLPPCDVPVYTTGQFTMTMLLVLALLVAAVAAVKTAMTTPADLGLQFLAVAWRRVLLPTDPSGACTFSR